MLKRILQKYLPPGHQALRFHKYIKSDLEKIQPQLTNLVSWPESWKKMQYKTYAAAEQFILPADHTETPLSQIIKRRKSQQSPISKPISRETLSQLLACAAGIRSDGTQKRHYPSAGARYPIELYILIPLEAVQGIPSGVYHYNVLNHTLEKMSGEQGVSVAFQTLPSQTDQAITILLSAVWKRSFEKYRNVGYKTTLLEAGHLSQNILLLATSFKLSCNPFIAFAEQELHTALQLPKDESILYGISVGC